MSVNRLQIDEVDSSLYRLWQMPRRVTGLAAEDAKVRMTTQASFDYQLAVGVPWLIHAGFGKRYGCKIKSAPVNPALQFQLEFLARKKFNEKFNTRKKFCSKFGTDNDSIFKHVLKANLSSSHSYIIKS